MITSLCLLLKTSVEHLRHKIDMEELHSISGRIRGVREALEPTCKADL